MRLLTVEEVAQVLNVSRARGYELIRRRMIPAVRIGRQVRVDASVLEAWIAAGGAESAPTDH